jgi:hypothetical protein
MLPRSLLDQGQIRLADRVAELGLYGSDELRLRQFASEATQVAFELAELSKLLGERHCNQQ